MVVAVQQPTPREDPLDSIIKGLAIAEKVYGVYTDYKKLQAEEPKRALEAKQAQENLTKTQQENKKLGLDIGNYGKPKPEDLTKAAQEDFKRANDLRSDYEGNYTTKKTSDVLSSFEKIKLAGNDPSPAGDISLLYSYMKMVDPGSMVKEGEFAIAETAGGVPERIWGQYNKALRGERLTDSQRQDFLDQSNKLMIGQLKAQKSIDDRFLNFAKKNKIDVSTFIPENYKLLEESKKPYFSRQPASLPGESKAQAAEPWNVDAFLTKSPR